MNKKELVKELSKRADLSSYMVEELFHITYDLIVEKLILDEVVEIPNMGTFFLAKKNAKGLLSKKKKRIEKICIYPIFKINESLKKKIKQKNGWKKTS